MQEQKLLFISICKVLSTFIEQNTKIQVFVGSSDRQKSASSIKPIKNAMANFYRQSFQLPISRKGITFQIYNAQAKQLLGQIVVPYNSIKSITNKKNIYEAKYPKFTIIWQGCLIGTNYDKQQQKTERNLFDPNQTQRGNSYSIENYQPAKNIRQKRMRSFKILPNQDAISQPSDSKQCTLELTDDTLQLNKISSLLDDKAKQKIYLHTQRWDHRQNQKNFKPVTKVIKDSINRNQQKLKLSQIKQSEIKLKRLSTIKSASTLKSIRCSSPNIKTSVNIKQNQKLKKSKSGLLSQISLKNLFSTAIVGVLSGLAATQF